MGTVAFLGVPDTRPRGRHLEVAALQDFTVAHRVLAVRASGHQSTQARRERDILFELPRDDVGEDLELAVRVRAEAPLRLDAVLVQHAQAAELVVPRIAVPA